MSRGSFYGETSERYSEEELAEFERNDMVEFHDYIGNRPMKKEGRVISTSKKRGVLIESTSPNTEGSRYWKKPDNPEKTGETYSEDGA